MSDSEAKTTPPEWQVLLHPGVLAKLAGCVQAKLPVGNAEAMQEPAVRRALGAAIRRLAELERMAEAFSEARLRGCFAAAAAALAEACASAAPTKASPDDDEPLGDAELAELLDAVAGEVQSAGRPDLADRLRSLSKQAAARAEPPSI